MEKKDVWTRYRKADRLFRSGSYLAAYTLLADINHTHPNDFRILYRMLLCLELLGKIQESCTLCVLMLQHFPDVNHQEQIYAVYVRLWHVAEDEPLAVLKSVSQEYPLLDAGRLHLQIKGTHVLQVGSHWIEWKRLIAVLVIIGVGVAALILLPVMLNRINPLRSEKSEVQFLGALLALMYVWNCFVMYLALWASNNLVEGDLLQNILEACLFAPVYLAFSFQSFSGSVLSDEAAPRYTMRLTEAIAFVSTIVLLNGGFIYFVILKYHGEKIFSLLPELRFGVAHLVAIAR